MTKYKTTRKLISCLVCALSPSPSPLSLSPVPPRFSLYIICCWNTHLTGSARANHSHDDEQWVWVRKEEENISLPDLVGSNHVNFSLFFYPHLKTCLLILERRKEREREREKKTSLWEGNNLLALICASQWGTSPRHPHPRHVPWPCTQESNWQLYRLMLQTKWATPARTIFLFF